jgi:beta-lactamase class A
MGRAAEVEREIRRRLDAFPGEASLTVEALRPDGTAETWISHRAEEVYPAASLIKLPLLIAALEAAERGELPLDRAIAVGGERTGGAGVVEHFRPGTLLTLADLLFCMIAVSDNAAANHVLALLDFAAVNETATRLGLRKTVLRRRMMNAAARTAGRENVTTAADSHSLLRQLVQPSLLSPSVAARALGILARQQIKLGGATFLPDERVAHKTGDLEGIFHDVGIIDPGGPVPVVYAFLSAGVPNLGEASVVAGRIAELVAVAVPAAEVTGERRAEEG